MGFTCIRRGLSRGRTDSLPGFNRALFLLSFESNDGRDLRQLPAGLGPPSVELRCLAIPSSDARRALEQMTGVEPANLLDGNETLWPS